MKEEVEQQQGVQSHNAQDRKTPSTPSRKSTTPSRMSRTPRLPSPSPSPVPQPRAAAPSPSPVTLQLPRKPQQTGVPKSTTNILPKMQQRTSVKLERSKENKLYSEMKDDGIIRTDSSDGVPAVAGSDSSNRSAESSFMFDVQQQEMVGASRVLSEVKLDSDIEMVDPASPSSSAVKTGMDCDASYSEMETQSTTSHVRKIDFDGVGSRKGEPAKAHSVQAAGDSRGAEGSGDKTENKLSKSDGHISLKMLLERKDGDRSALNKSLGVLEKSKNTLYVNQSTVSGRSAFVPFSQVQNRKEAAAVSQAVTSGIPIFIPSSTITQSTSMAMIAVPSSIVTGSHDHATGRVPESIIKILPSTAAFQFKQGGTDSLVPNVVIQPSELSPLLNSCPQKSSASSSTSSSTTVSAAAAASSSCLTKDTQTLVTSSLSMLKSSSCDSLVSLSPSVSTNASTVAKHAKTRFTPIRPKASPNKVTSAKENKGDNPAYDKRPVSEILKEKRAAKFQAEAMAKLQVRLPTIPVQTSLGFPSNLGQLQTVPSSVSAKEVVIIVNNQAGGTSIQNMMTPSMLVAQSLIKTETGNQSVEANQRDEMTVENKPENVAEGKEPEYTEIRKLDDMEHSGCGKTVVDEEYRMVPDNVTMGMARDIDREAEQRDKVELMWHETPPKLAKLNITSPFRPESACSLGRDTPVRIMKTSDLCSSRPESACSFGRETPSGARKRKSSDLDKRRDFKRLNSTGDEGDDILNLKLITMEACSPESESRLGGLVRRTRSCTYELDKDTRVSYPLVLADSSQSPDISSLEREALIESGYPQNICSGNQQKIQAQTSSVGVSAKSFRQFQQKLIKNKTDLDQRVRNFLQKDDKFSTGENTKIASIQRPKTSQDNLVSKDSAQMLRKIEHDVRHGLLSRSRSGTGGFRLDNEPSGLPSDVADWINEAIEKRQCQNPSVMSEPDLSVLTCRRPHTADLGLTDFKFEVARPVSQGNEQPTLTAAKHAKDTEKPADTTFTVPKVPAVNSRPKDYTGRSSVDQLGKSTRCQSLPSFTSPNQSPVSPVPGGRSGLFRATSMSPRTQPPDTAEVTSPVHKMDAGDGGQLMLSLHAGSRLREEGRAQDESRTSAGSYLASMQHALQKPVDTSLCQDLNGAKSRDILTETIPTLAGQAVSSKSPFSRDGPAAMERNLSQIPERFISQTPFSDSGYQSTGPSPVLNSTPDLENTQHMARPLEVMEPASQPVSLQAQLLCTGPLASNQSFLSTALPTEPLTTSANSAFVPIQSSNQDSRYVTPIKPTVTLPNSNHPDSISAYTANLLVEPGQSEAGPEPMMVSPQAYDPPPSYETAIRSLRKGFTESGQVAAQAGDNFRGGAQPSGQSAAYSPGQILQDIIQTQAEVSQKEAGRVPLLANMGSSVESEGKQGMYGPFASKLVQLSLQTQQRPFVPPKTMPKDATGAGVMSQVDNAFQPAAGDTRQMLRMTPESSGSILVADMLETGSPCYKTAMNLSEGFLPGTQSDLSSGGNPSEGATQSPIQYRSPADVDFISPSHLSTSSHSSFFKASPSLSLKDHSSDDNISQPIRPYSSVLTGDTTAISRQDMLNFAGDVTDNPSFSDSQFEAINLVDDSIKGLDSQKEFGGTDAELADFNLAEALKELDSQYGGGEVYSRGLGQGQQLEGFPMFED